MRFIDSNIFLRYMTQDNLAQQQIASDIFAAIQRGDEEGFTTDVHIHETVYVLASPRVYNLPHGDIGNRLRPLLALSGLRIRNKRVCLEALDIFAQYEALDYADALAVAHMRNQGIVGIYSFDKHFDRVAGITRIKDG
jgi:uncharacterized protein